MHLNAVVLLLQGLVEAMISSGASPRSKDPQMKMLQKVNNGLHWF